MASDEPITTTGGESEPERFMKLFAANQRRLYGFVRTLVASAADAEDLVQDTVTILWRKRAEFVEGTDFAAWAIRVARFEVLNRRRKAGAVALFDADVIERLADEAAQLAGESDRRREALHACVGKLPLDQRDLLRLHYDESLNVEQIAERAGRSRRTVYRTLQQVHAALLGCIRRTLAE